MSDLNAFNIFRLRHILDSCSFLVFVDCSCHCCDLYALYFVNKHKVVLYCRCAFHKLLCISHFANKKCRASVNELLILSKSNLVWKCLYNLGIQLLRNSPYLTDKCKTNNTACIFFYLISQGHKIEVEQLHQRFMESKHHFALYASHVIFKNLSNFWYTSVMCYYFIGS